MFPPPRHMHHVYSLMRTRKETNGDAAFFKLLGICPLGIKDAALDHHISAVTLLGAAPGHTKQPTAHNGIIVCWACSHCRPCYRIYSLFPILGPSPLTPSESLLILTFLDALFLPSSVRARQRRCDDSGRCHRGERGVKVCSCGRTD